MSTPTPVSKLTDLARRLGDLVAKENDLLRQRRPGELGAFSDEKDRLTEAYERQVLNLKQNPKLLQANDAATLDRLKDATSYFQVQLEEHRRVVQAAKSVTERMLNAISESVNRGRRTVQAYDRAAVMGPVFGNARTFAPLALNTVV